MCDELFGYIQDFKSLYKADFYSMVLYIRDLRRYVFLWWWSIEIL